MSIILLKIPIYHKMSGKKTDTKRFKRSQEPSKSPLPQKEENKTNTKRFKRSRAPSKSPNPRDRSRSPIRRSRSISRSRSPSPQKEEKKTNVVIIDVNASLCDFSKQSEFNKKLVEEIYQELRSGETSSW